MVGTDVVHTSDRRVTVDVDGVAEVVGSLAVPGRELIFESPRCAAAHEDVDGALTVLPVDVVAESADRDRVAAYGDGAAEAVTLLGEGSGEMLFELPRFAVAREDEDRAR